VTVPTFVTPVLLAGALLVVVPIVLHLVMRERPRHLEFPALRFVKRRREANRRRLRFRHLLLLLLRCAAILLLAFALARPIFQSAGPLGGGRTPVAAALAFDTRPRMEYRHHNKTRLEVAKQMGQEVLEQLPHDSQLVVMDSANARTRFDVDRGAAAQRIGQLTVAGDANGLIEMVDNALRVVRSSDQERKEIYLLTDMSASDWESSTNQAAWQRRLDENEEVDFYLIDIGIDQPQNFALGDLELSREVVAETDLLRVSTEVLHVGAAGERTVQLFVLDDDGQAEKKGEKNVVCRDGEATWVDFQATVGRVGTYRGYVQLARSDNLEVDNIRYFNVRVKPPWQVLIAAGDPPERRARMLATALSPPTLRRRGDAQYEFDIVSHDTLAGRPLQSFDAIWLLDPPPLPAKLWNGLTGYVDAGGGLAIALGGSAGLSPDRFNETASLDLLPAELRRQWKRDDLYLAPVRLEHPVLQRFKDREGDIPWQRNPVFKIWQLGALAEGARVVIPYSDGRPALVARDVGRGRSLTLTTSLTSPGRSPWNDLLSPREDAWPGFVLVNAIADYLVGSAGQRLNYRVGELADVSLDRDGEQFPSYLLTTPKSSRRVQPDDDGTRLLITGTEFPGHYKIAAGGRQGVQYGFSVNLPAAATALGRADPELLEQAFDDARLPIVNSLAELRESREVTAARTRWEAAPWLIIVVAVAVAGEGLMATFFYRKRGKQLPKD